MGAAVVQWNERGAPRDANGGEGLILLEVNHPDFERARDDVAPLAELVKAPDGFHTYRLTPLSLWNAAALGVTADQAVERLRRHAELGLPDGAERAVREWLARYGRLTLRAGQGAVVMEATDPETLDRALEFRDVAVLVRRTGPNTAEAAPGDRGVLKQELVRAGWPARDCVGYAPFQPLAVGLKDPSILRPYQREALDAFFENGGPGDDGGSGILCLPCGAGKTLIGLGAIARLGCEALVITSNTTAARQWVREAVARTTLRPEQVGEYTGSKKQVRPLTVTTYSLLVTRPRQHPHGEAPPHLELLGRAGFGIIVYDEVHLLPAPVFRATAEIQAKRRLGLTATLVREDGREGDVFALVGPKRADVGWRRLEALGFLAEARCVEIRVPLSPALRDRYAFAALDEAFRLASTNPQKDDVALRLLERHREDRVLIIGTYLDQLERIAKCAGAPLITGATGEGERDRLFGQFRRGDVRVLAVSKVANFAIDLPDANVAIELSGTYGSRQEEAQRLGRVLRPKANGSGAWFYVLVTDETRELDAASRRQRFLLEQGYRYDVVPVEDLEEALA